VRARVLLTWALQLRNWGIFEEAARRAERSLEIRLELGDTYGAALCHGVIAFIHQRRGDAEAERDALVADLRAIERMGGAADAPALQGRLAGALVGLGKYAGAWAAAEESIRSRRSPASPAPPQPTAAAPKCLRPARDGPGLPGPGPDGGRPELAARGRAVFERLRDGYGGRCPADRGGDRPQARTGEAGADVRVREMGAPSGLRAWGRS
jgi:hypothetical protein